MKKQTILLVVLLAVAAGGGYWWFAAGGDKIAGHLAQPDTPDRTIFGSGTVEAEEIAITSQLGGRVVEIPVDEGDEVQTGELLLQLDATDYLAQQRELHAALAAAKAQKDEVKAGPRPADVAVARAQLQQAVAAASAAELIWQQAVILADNPQEINIQLDEMRGQLAAAKKNVEAAQTQLKMAEIECDEALRDQSNDAALTQQQIAQKQVDAAVIELEMVKAQGDGIRAQIEQLEKMAAFPVHLIVQANQAGATYHLAQAGVEVAQANLTAVTAGTRPADIAVADAQLAQAAAALTKLDVYLDMLALTAPQSGIVAQRFSNVGELVAPGAVLLTLIDLDQVKLTVFVPETQIGRVQEGQTAHVCVDAYPDLVFEGAVAYIAPQAEFTPKNVQTKEERVNLVFAVKIRLDNPDHRLRPGMPADAHILSDL